MDAPTAQGRYGTASLENDNEADDTGDEKEESHRGKDISKRPKIRDELLKTFKDIEKGFRDQWERANDQLDYWDVYNCKIGPKQFYSGNAKIFVPIVKNAIDARKTRFTNQIFPQGGRYVEVVSQDSVRPDAIAALLESYVRKSQLRTKVMPALMKAGDIEGQYNVLVSWCQTKRHVTWRTKKQPEMEEGVENPAADEVDDIRQEEVETARPNVEVVPDSDILVLPQTADTLEEAVREMGGSVTVIRRLGKAAVRRLIKEGAIREDEGEDLIEAMDKKSPGELVNQSKEMVDAAGIKGSEGKKHALVYRTWTMLKVKGEERLCEAYYGGKEQILGCRINPLWCDRMPLLSVPVEKVANVFKGRSKIAAVADLQYAANDAINEAWDSAAYALMPVIMTDPEKNPRTGSMILSMSAIWETSPKDTQVIEFPQLWQHGFEMVNACKNEVTQTLNVSPAAITQGIAPQQKQKQSQAQIAQEQQVDILTTADSVTVVEEGILSPLLALFVELDHQYRDEEVTVRAYGEMGLKAGMEKIPPVQMDRRYQFKWYGIEQTRNAQQVQQQISALNVVSQMGQQGPDVFQGWKLNLQPWVTHLFENVFGPRLTPQIWKSPEQQMPVPAQEENRLLSLGHEVTIHADDEDEQHLPIHSQDAQRVQQEGGNTRPYRVHMWMHMQQQKKKMQAQQQQAQGQQPGQQQGKPPGAAPKPGAMNKPPRGGQGPAGMIPHDQMKDPQAMPRKMGGGGRMM
jgi:hypothetical protein